jgi:Lipopolysaccharide-assembly
MGTAGGPANLSQTLTEKLKEYYQRNTSLKLKSSDADLQIESTIIGYEQSAATQTSSDKAAQNRLTIRVEIRFKNLKNENESFEKEFSFFRDYNADQNLTQAEKKIVPEILDQIVLDIFNNTAANW